MDTIEHLFFTADTAVIVGAASKANFSKASSARMLIVLIEVIRLFDFRLDIQIAALLY